MDKPRDFLHPLVISTGATTSTMPTGPSQPATVLIASTPTGPPQAAAGTLQAAIAPEPKIRKLEIAGRIFELPEIDDDLDAAVDALHKQHFDSTIPKPGIDWASFKAAITKYLATSPPPEEVSLFFRALTPVSDTLQKEGKFQAAQLFWRQIVELVRAIENRTSPAEKYHKGSAYYYWGVVALSCGDLEHLVATLVALMVRRRSTI